MLDVLPCRPANDTADVSLSDAEQVSDNMLRNVTSEFSDADNLVRGQGRHSVYLTASAHAAISGCAMASLVVHVLFAGSPREVFNAVVEEVSVEVPTLLTGWAWSDECLQNNRANVEAFGFAPVGKVYDAGELVNLGPQEASLYRDGRPSFAPPRNKSWDAPNISPYGNDVPRVTRVALRKDAGSLANFGHGWPPPTAGRGAVRSHPGQPSPIIPQV